MDCSSLTVICLGERYISTCDMYLSFESHVFLFTSCRRPIRFLRCFALRNYLCKDCGIQNAEMCCLRGYIRRGILTVGCHGPAGPLKFCVDSAKKRPQLCLDLT